MDFDRPIYVFQAGGKHEQMRETGWPDGMNKHGDPVVADFRADWLYYQIIGFSVDNTGANLPNFGVRWTFQGILQEATQPALLQYKEDQALPDLKAKGWHSYKRWISNSYYRQSSEHPDPTAPPYPQGAEIDPDNPVEMSPAAKQYLADVLRNE
jgi:hypothetical protein